MITDLKPYPAMKDSGVEWLGEVPEHWEVRKLRRILHNVAERNRPDLPLLSVVRKKGVILRDVSSKDENHNFIPDDLTNYKVVRTGQFAMNKMKAWQGSYGVSRYDGIVSPAYFIFEVEDVKGDFFHAVIRSKAYVPFFTQASDGVRIGQWDLSQARMREIAFLVPPLPEQAAIARYLDHVDRRVRRLVRAKRKLIALLIEQKQAIIHRAVTSGLDPDVPLKDSGVEWLGEVPKHWEVVTLRRVIFSAIDGPHHSPAYVDEGIPFLSARNIKTDGWSLADTKYISEADYAGFSRRVVPEPGDVLYTKGGTTGVARTVDLDFRFQVWVHVAVLKVVKRKILPEFLAMALNSPRCYEQSQLFTRGATNQDLGLNRMKGIYLTLPPKEEQAEILEYLEKELRDTRKAITSANREIELLNEYRTRLVADVVTGKLDVHEAAAALPEVDPLAANGEPDDAFDTDAATDLDELDAIPEEDDA